MTRLILNAEHVALGLARWYMGRLIPVISGGDGRDEPLFPQIPADLASLDDEQLAEQRDSLLARIREVTAGHRDPDVVGARLETEVEEEMAAAVTAVRQIKDELAARATATAAHDAEIARLASEAGIDAETETDADADASDDETDDDAADDAADSGDSGDEGLQAAAAAPARRPLPAARRHRPTAQETDTRGLRLTTQASTLGAPFEAQQTLGRNEMGEVLTEMVNKRVRPGERVIVAAATYDYPEERILDQRHGMSLGVSNTEKVHRAIAQINREHFSPSALQALVASGALCAPLTPIYDLPGVETPARPVRDGLPSFQATRGGVQVGATPVMGDYADAVGVITAAENAAGGTSAVKGCLRVPCPEFDTFPVDSIYACREFDNLAGRAYPEWMARSDELVRAEQARLADGRLLTTMASAAAGATVLTGGFASPGAMVSFLGDVYAAAAQYRSSNRMPENATLQAFLPTWIIDLLALDVASGQFDRFKTRADIIRILGNAGIATTFYLDGSATATDGQVFAHATAGSIDGFPASVEWFLFAPGTWLHLDSGQLDLGVVRDSTLNSTNDMQIFYETWEGLVKVGGDSYAITTTVCPSGEVVAPNAPGIACAT